MTKVRFDVPVPERRQKRDYQFDKMDKVGAFMFFPDVKPVNITAALQYAKKTGKVPSEWKFIVRVYEENGVKGTGVWRVE